MRVRLLAAVLAALAAPAAVWASPAAPAAGPESDLAAYSTQPPAKDEVAARFRYASALAGVGRNDEAIAAFEALVADFPTVPEPYNNLAALYAHEGDFDKARQVLERGMNTSASYAAIYENLSTVYVEMARSSYVKALRVKESPPAPKLQMLTSLERTPAVAAPPAVAAARPTPPPPAVLAPPAPIPAKAAAAAPDPAPAPAPAETPAVDVGAAAVAALERWAQAWSAQDVDAYLAAYDESFDPGDGLTRTAWAEQRRDRLGRPEWIKIELADFEVNAAAPQVVIEAKQRYSSNSYGDHTLKRFELVERDGRWLIRVEQTLRALP